MSPQKKDILIEVLVENLRAEQGKVKELQEKMSNSTNLKEDGMFSKKLDEKNSQIDSLEKKLAAEKSALVPRGCD